MKHLGFALFALFLLFFVASCKNTPDSEGNTSTADIQATEDTAVPDAASVKALNKKIEFDLVTQRGISYKNKPLSEETISLLRNVRPIWAGTEGETKERVTKIYEKLMGFFEPYQAHMISTNALDSLSVHLVAGKVSTSEAQKKYETIMAKMLEEGKKMEEGKDGLDVPALTNEFQAILTTANIKAGGGR